MKGLAALIHLIFRIAFYLGIGAMFYAIFVGTQFDPHSLLMWGWLLAWPIATFVMLLALFGVVGIAVLLLVFIGIVMLAYYAKLQGWVKRRRAVNMLRRRTSQR